MIKGGGDQTNSSFGFTCFLVVEAVIVLRIETLNRGPLALLLQRQNEFPFGINIEQFSFSFFKLRTDSPGPGQVPSHKNLVVDLDVKHLN